MKIACKECSRIHVYFAEYLEQDGLGLILADREGYAPIAADWKLLFEKRLTSAHIRYIMKADRYAAEEDEGKQTR